MSFNADWEQEAANWLAWARTPGHDVYWHYRSAFFELVPPAGSGTLEIGCGEGRFERDGLEMTFRGWSYPLETYGRALESARLCLEALREPPMPKADPDEARWRRIPMFLMFRATCTGARR